MAATPHQVTSGPKRRTSHARSRVSEPNAAYKADIVAAAPVQAFYVSRVAECETNHAGQRCAWNELVVCWLWVSELRPRWGLGVVNRPVTHGDALGCRRLVRWATEEITHCQSSPGNRKVPTVAARELWHSQFDVANATLAATRQPSIAQAGGLGRRGDESDWSPKGARFGRFQCAVNAKNTAVSPRRSVRRFRCRVWRRAGGIRLGS